MYSIPILILALLALGIFARGAWRSLERERESRELVRELESKTTQLEARRAQLETGIAKLNTEEGINEELKSKYNISAEGEQFIVLVDPRENKNTTSTSSSLWYERWWNGLKNLFR